MPSYLKDVSITFNTHNDDKDASTVVHVFVKNRRSSSQSPEAATDFISNLLALQRYQNNGDLSDADRDPYLAYGLNLSQIDPPNPVIPGVPFDDPSSVTYSLELSSNTITAEEIDLPAVNIHILTDGDDRWIFDYAITFTFDDTSAFSYSSKADGGINGIILDQDNHNYSGICSENPFRKVEPLVKPITDSVLKKVTIEFATNKDDKDNDTRLNVHIVNRLSATQEQDIAIGLDLFHGEVFPDDGSSLAARYKSYSWSSDDGSLAANPIRLADMVLPMAYIVIVPNGNDQWTFDYQVTFEFSDPHDFGQKRQIYSWRTNGIVLDQDNNKYAGVYQGRPFPTQAGPATAPVLTDEPVDRTNPPKTIPIAFLHAKFDEFINQRNGRDNGDSPPIRRIRLHNSGETNSAVLRESYADVRSITALNKHFVPGQPKVAYVSSPRSLGQLSHVVGSLYLNDINSAALTLTVDPTQPEAPFTLTIVFDTSGSNETVGGVGGMNFLKFEISLKLTLDVARTVNQFGAETTVVDVMSWVDQLETLPVSPAGLAERVMLIEKFVHVSLTTEDAADPGGFVRQGMRDSIFAALTTPDVISKKTARDGINSVVTSWLLGGVADDDRNTDGNNAVLDHIAIDQDNVTISYAGPRKVFVPATPPDWPAAGNPSAAHDFSPGSLSNIDHIVVLMMENRSFDHILGYLSLPVADRGMGRSDVDGLKGGEENSYLGTVYPSYPLTDTLFAPDPPHGYEPVAHAINGGAMDGFASSFGNAHGAAIAGRIMGHHTASTVPTYDALARDFAIGHRWFASHPGPTFCNRFYMLTGRLNLDARGFWEFDNSSPMRPVFTPTIFDYLSDASHSDTGEPVSWAYFEHGYCSLRFYERHTFDDANIFRADDPEYGFYARASAGTLPSVSFIDPHYVENPPNANCDGPPADIQAGQAFVRGVVEAVVASPAWNKTMLVIVYDEHGGFYDHVPPPPGPAVSADLPIKTLGIRVPVFVISPWVRAGSVFGSDGPVVAAGSAKVSRALGQPPTAVEDTGLHFDHTSILKTIARRFMSANPPFMGARYAAANDLSQVIGNELRQSQFLPFIRYNIQYATSQMMLDVQNANPAPGTQIWQFGANGTVAQDFAFEDAGDGLVYIRSNVSNLYVTVDVAHEPQVMGNAEAAAPQPAPAPVGHGAGLGVAVRNALAGLTPDVRPVASTGDVSTGGAGSTLPGLIQDVKYAPSGILGNIVVGRPDPECQRWRLTSVSPAVADRDLFAISSQAFPGKLLQPADPLQAGSAIVLGDPESTAGVHSTKNVWKVSSPLIYDELVMTQ